MLFNSLTFIQFFALVLAIHHLPLPWNLKKANLLVASYLFYAAWNPPFVILIWVSTMIDWYAAKGIAASSKPRIRRSFVVLSLVTNLGLLGYFKYAGFVLDSFVALLRIFGIEFQPLKLDIVLPVGISFYTFQTLSYTIDVYRKEIPPARSFLDYALYVTFFPQLVAGPIVRAADFLPQCVHEHRANRSQLGWGLSLFTIGLFEKVVIADALLAPISDRVYGEPAAASMLDAWTGTLAFSGQIFCDFAGYSTCAIGAAMCLGFAIQDNFHFPYAAAGFSDFWRRWHISLSSWLRDYLYISLGGNRRGGLRTYLNLAITMLLGGLWHGANWTFVVWGGLHGAYLAAERLLKARVPAWRLWERLPARVTLALITYAGVLFAWIFFRARSLSDAGLIVGSMAGSPHAAADPLIKTTETALVLAVSACLLGLHWLMRETTVEETAARIPWPLRALAFAGMLYAIMTMAGDNRSFIYFQF